MLLSNFKLDTIFKGFLDSDLGSFRPTILIGNFGTGRFTYIKSFIRSVECEYYNPFLSNSDGWYEDPCSCLICRKILEEASPDFLILNGKESIADFKLKCVDFVNSSPVELRNRYIVFRNFDLYPKNIVDISLKFIEEPQKYLKILATSRYEGRLPGAIVSRFLINYTPNLSDSSLKLLCDKIKTLNAYKASITEYPFNTVNQIIYYHRFSYKSWFNKLFKDLDNINSLDKDLDAFLSLIKEDKRFFLEEVLEFFLYFYIDSARASIKTNNIQNQAWTQFHNFFEVLLQRFEESLFRYLTYQNNYFYINIKNQLFLFFSSILTLKKMFNV